VQEVIINHPGRAYWLTPLSHASKILKSLLLPEARLEVNGGSVNCEKVVFRGAMLLVVGALNKKVPAQIGRPSPVTIGEHHPFAISFLRGKKIVP